MILPFGKFKGQEIDSTPTEYLKWFEENVDCSTQLREAINAELKVRSSEETLGRSIESPAYKSFEEMLFQHLMTWIVEENNADRLRLNFEQKEIVSKSLARTLKDNVPRLQKLWKAQLKSS